MYDIVISSTIDQCECIENIFENNFHKIYKFNKKLRSSDELKISTTVSTKKSLKDMNELFKTVCPINSIEIREHYV